VRKKLNSALTSPGCPGKESCRYASMQRYPVELPSVSDSTKDTTYILPLCSTLLLSDSSLRDLRNKVRVRHAYLTNTPSKDERRCVQGLRPVPKEKKTRNIQRERKIAHPGQPNLSSTKIILKTSGGTHHSLVSASKTPLFRRIPTAAMVSFPYLPITSPKMVAT
jgi:hypothetical protein